MSNITISRPTPGQAAAMLDRSSPSILVPIRASIAEWFSSQIPSMRYEDNHTAELGAVMSDALATYLTQLSRLRSIGEGMTKQELSAANRKTALSRWEKWRKETGREKGTVVRSGKTVRGLVCDSARMIYEMLSENNRERVLRGGDLVMAGLRGAMQAEVSAYCSEHPEIALNSVSLPKSVMDSVREVSINTGFAVSKVISFAIERGAKLAKNTESNA